LRAPHKGAFFFDALTAVDVSCKAFEENPAYSSGKWGSLHPEGAGQGRLIALFPGIAAMLCPRFPDLNPTEKTLYSYIDFMMKGKM